jgi:hypothetical protein
MLGRDETMPLVEVIVSEGQTGADRGALVLPLSTESRMADGAREAAKPKTVPSTHVIS